jgi:ribosomal protein S18 acetylase RimI-like enzyme
LNNLPNVGRTSDPGLPLELETPPGPPAAFPDLENVEQSFIAIGGDFFVVVDDQDHVLGMGGFKPVSPDAVEVLRVRVHPATTRRGIGRMLMARIEERAFELGYGAITLDTATNQPEAVAFYEGLGYRELRRESRREWTWTLVYFEKVLGS